MSTKHFIHDPARLVSDALHGLTITNPSLALDEEYKAILYIPQPGEDHTVSIISGGGSGHEPSFGAYVGKGLLSGAVSGTIFASPSSEQILHAIEQADSSKGVLVTVMNYTGDVLNFGLAVEKAKARTPNLRIEILIVGDDVGVPRSQAGKVGRRGIAGTCLVHKITGAAAAQGQDLAQILELGKQASSNLVSVGVSLDRVHVPGRGGSDGDQSLPQDEVELGMGIHNEPGSGRRRGTSAELPPLVSEMLAQLISSDDPERGFIQTISKGAVLLVNNLGGLSPLELGAVTTEVVRQLDRDYAINLSRVYSGTFMTSLNGPGFSISLLFLDSSREKEFLGLLDYPTSACGWTGPCEPNSWAPSKSLKSIPKSLPKGDAAEIKSQLVCDIQSTLRHLKVGLTAVIEAEPEVIKFDTIVGDGDCGTTLKRGAEVILGLCRNVDSDILQFLASGAAAVERSMDGTSGALYSIFLNAFTAYFRSRAAESIVVDQDFWIAALSHATAVLPRYTPARVGDRTMMDALIPFQEALVHGKSFTDAANAAVAGAERSRDLVAKLGRAVYVGRQEDWVGSIPDPGAWGLSKFLYGLAQPLVD